MENSLFKTQDSDPRNAKLVHSISHRKENQCLMKEGTSKTV